MALNWSGAAGGALSGAATGATLGSAVPGIGTAIGTAGGALIGGTLGLFSGGTKDKLKKVPTGSPQQEALQNQILQRALGMGQGGGADLANQYYNNLLGPNQQQAYNQFSQPYLQQFQEQILPLLAERYAGAGALSSSGFGQAIGGASAGLQAQLAQLFSELQGQAASQQYGQYNQLAQTGLNYQPFAYNRQEGSAGFLGPFLTALGTETAKSGTNAIATSIADLFKPKSVGYTAIASSLPFAK